MLWVIPKFQRAGMATLLADLAIDRCGLPKEEFPWLYPFTDSGEAFVRAYLSGSFTVGR
jgi:hypothetical protein